MKLIPCIRLTCCCNSTRRVAACLLCPFRWILPQRQASNFLFHFRVRVRSLKPNQLWLLPYRGNQTTYFADHAMFVEFAMSPFANLEFTGTIRWAQLKPSVEAMWWVLKFYCLLTLQLVFRFTKILLYSHTHFSWCNPIAWCSLPLCDKNDAYLPWKPVFYATNHHKSSKRQGERGRVRAILNAIVSLPIVFCLFAPPPCVGANRSLSDSDLNQQWRGVCANFLCAKVFGFAQTGSQLNALQTS